MKPAMKYFTVALSQEKYQELKSLARRESRPLAQMARVIIEKALSGKDGE